MIDPNWFVTKMEEKLVELMGAEEYDRWSTEVAKKAFRIDIEEMADGDFKEFCKANFDAITGNTAEFGEFLKGVGDGKTH